jgi:hypothetical protein
MKMCTALTAFIYHRTEPIRGTEHGNESRGSINGGQIRGLANITSSGRNLFYGVSFILQIIFIIFLTT